MIIYGIENQQVEIRVEGYEFPDINSSYDDNWLSIFIDVQTKNHKWQSTFPSLLTWEIEGLVEWFETLAENKKPKWYKLNYFTEPNLSFEILNDYTDSLKKFRIIFDLEFRPPNSDDDTNYFIEFWASNEELKKIAKNFETELKKYPQRKALSIKKEKENIFLRLMYFFSPLLLKLKRKGQIASSQKKMKERK